MFLEEVLHLQPAQQEPVMLVEWILKAYKQLYCHTLELEQPKIIFNYIF